MHDANAEAACFLSSHRLRSPFLLYHGTGGTRCCIHTPSAPLQLGDISGKLVEQALDGASLVFFDGRLTEAALVLADAARVSRENIGKPVLCRVVVVTVKLTLAFFDGRLTEAALVPSDAAREGWSKQCQQYLVLSCASVPSARLWRC